ncbi:prolyl oligopeptidase family serine peptidase [Aquabacterium humicola]|uniref:prolyl oligopeptidase family serine peptidase n=1 Tax=Aquabacterium humicola TaxID=3237377 RepID=UPI00254391DF|nr:prolyl oligopeptidase family serine peptidase [Rubrivivax pictus]
MKASLVKVIAAALLLGAALGTARADGPVADPYLWLEDVQGERALDWVRAQNKATRAVLEVHPSFAATREQLRAVLDSTARIPQVTRHGAQLYNLWRDAGHPRGLWRRTTLDEYRKAEPAWETVLDLDALAAAEKENWVWGGAQCLGPSYRRCLLSLSRGGADAKVLREFDTVDKRFVDGGFTLPEAKSDVTWAGADTLYVATDFGAGSMTTSGYPRIVKRWQRGTPLAAATTVFEAEPADVGADVEVDFSDRGRARTVLTRYVSRWDIRRSLLGEDGRLQAIPIPRDARLRFWGPRALIELKSDWQGHARGALLVADFAALMRGEATFERLFEPTAKRSLAGYATTRTQLLLNVLEDVAGRLEAWAPAADGWRRRDIATPAPGTLTLAGLHDPWLADDALAEAYWVTHTSLLAPDTLYLADTARDQLQRTKALPAFFDADGARVEQRFAVSKDGTRVPYFIVWPKGAKADGDNPTLLYGYGGFEIAQLPRYLPTYGSAWVAKGGVFVIANIRGGGEYGPAWHQAAIKANKQKSYDDFAAVAEDLAATKVTRAKRLGMLGGSNGGLLVGAVMLQRPELFGAVVCKVPLLDMQRYHKLLAGASWMSEYGNPDKPEEWAWIAPYSPYQNVQAGAKLPKVLFTTSTRDDRVHPGHARKMAARMVEQGHAPLYYENIEGGHAGAADNAQRADLLALEFAFLWRQLGGLDSAARSSTR